jgi:hypothetical protein
VENRTASQISCGYNCQLEETPGEWQGQRYDAIQRAIRYNHVALEPIGRAGPEVGIRLDAGDAIQVSPHSQEQTTMLKIRIDGVDFEATEQLAQAFTVAQEKAAKALDEVKAQLKAKTDDADKQKARADSLDEELKKAKAAHADAADPSKIEEAVKTRVALERTAGKVLGETTKFDEMTDADIKRAVILKVHPGAEAQLKDASAVYLQDRFDAAVDAIEAGDVTNPELAKARQAAGRASGANDMEKIRTDAMKRESEAWKTPLSATKDARN